jgi:hypothetical protein
MEQLPVCTACLKPIEGRVVHKESGYFGEPLPLGAVFHDYICDIKRHPSSSQQDRR